MQANQTLAALRLPAYSEAVFAAFEAVAATDRGSPERENVILAEDRAWRQWLRENHAAFKAVNTAPLEIPGPCRI
jgi:hypothetical protein